MTLNDGLFNLGRILAGQDLVALLKVVLEAGRYIRRFHQPPGMYEVLEHHARLELHDIKGKKATYFKDQKVRFLQDHIMAYQDQAWGDGNIFADYKCWLLVYNGTENCTVQLHRTPKRSTNIV